jgi:hypothetical protein
MIEYCKNYQCILEESRHERRTFEAGDGRILLTRNRSDFVERVLHAKGDKAKTKTHAHIVHIAPERESTVRGSLKKVRSKVNLDKLEKVHSVAKIRLSNYKDSLVETDAESLKNYDIIKKIGAGSFGTVFLIRKKHSSSLFALKRLNKSYVIQNQLKKYAYS